MTAEELQKMHDEVEKLHTASRIEASTARLYILCGFMVDSLVHVFAGNTQEATNLLKSALTAIVRLLRSDTPESHSLAEEVLALLRSREDTSPEFQRFMQELAPVISESKKPFTLAEANQYLWEKGMITADELRLVQEESEEENDGQRSDSP